MCVLYSCTFNVCLPEKYSEDMDAIYGGKIVIDFYNQRNVQMPFLQFAQRDLCHVTIVSTK